MKTYFTGTTLECFHSILKDGFIKKRPERRVWIDWSEDYTYFIPSKNEHEETTTLLSYAFEQADFAVYELDGTKRVILEVEGLEESLLEEDKDSSSIFAVRYPCDVPISCIKNVYIEQEDNSLKVKEFIAITKLFLPENEEELLKAESLMFTCDDEELEFAYRNINIRHANLIPAHVLYDRGELENKYHDYHEELDYFISYDCISLEVYLENHNSMQVA